MQQYIPAIGASVHITKLKESAMLEVTNCDHKKASLIGRYAFKITICDLKGSIILKCAKAPCTIPNTMLLCKAQLLHVCFNFGVELSPLGHLLSELLSIPFHFLIERLVILLCDLGSNIAARR